MNKKNNENKKTQWTLGRVCDDLIVGSAIGYIILLIIIKVLDAKKVIQYANFKPGMIIAAGIILVICTIRYAIEKAKTK